MRRSVVLTEGDLFLKIIYDYEGFLMVKIPKFNFITYAFILSFIL